MNIEGCDSQACDTWRLDVVTRHYTETIANAGFLLLVSQIHLR